MPAATAQTVSVVGIDIGKNLFHIVGLDDRGQIVLRQKWSRGQVRAPTFPRWPGRFAGRRPSGIVHKTKAAAKNAQKSPTEGTPVYVAEIEWDELDGIPGAPKIQIRPPPNALFRPGERR